jgi:hypothetical protein
MPNSKGGINMEGMEKETKLEIIENAGNANTMPMILGGGRFIIGYVSEINGREAREVPEYVPTVWELEQLVEYWTAVEVEHAIEWWFTRSTSSIAWREHVYAERQLDRLSSVLEKEDFNRAVSTAYVAFEKRVTNKGDWLRFLGGGDSPEPEFTE